MSALSKTQKRLMGPVPENIQTGQINGMGPIELPADGLLGSGDVPAGKGDAEEEYKKKKKKMSSFEKFISKLNDKAIDQSSEGQAPSQFETVTVDEARTSSLGKLEYTEEDVEQTYGWCGTLSDEVGNEKAMDLTHRAIKELTSFFKWKGQWTALALVNSKAGRHAADAFLRGETDPDIVSAFIWYYGSESKVNKHAKEERELQFPGV